MRRAVHAEYAKGDVRMRSAASGAEQDKVQQLRQFRAEAAHYILALQSFVSCNLLGTTWQQLHEDLQVRC